MPCLSAQRTTGLLQRLTPQSRSGTWRTRTFLMNFKALLHQRTAFHGAYHCRGALMATFSLLGPPMAISTSMKLAVLRKSNVSREQEMVPHDLATIWYCP